MKKIMFFLLLFMLCESSIGQTKVTADEVRKASSDVEYKKMKTKWVLRNPPNIKDPKPMPNIEGTSEFLKIIAILLIAIFVLALLYFIFKDVNLRKSLIEAKEIQLDHIEDITSIDFNTLMKEAIEKKDYRLATRIKFLMLLQVLQQKGKIVWKPNKTNRAYGAELSDTPLGNPFQKLSGIFEKAWYGKNEVDENHYTSIQEQFDSMLKMI